MSQTNIETKATANEIDIIELIKNIWKQKITIIASILLMIFISSIYAYTATPIYRVQAQLTKPSLNNLSLFEANIDIETLNSIFLTNNLDLETQELLALFKNTSDSKEKTIDKPEPNDIFKEFLFELSSNSHILQVAFENKDLTKESLGISIDNNYLDKISNYRSLKIPSTQDKINAIEPEIYAISLTGINREKLNTLLQNDLNKAQLKVTEKFKTKTLNTLDFLIQNQKDEKNVKLKTQEKLIHTHKEYLASSNKNTIKNLREALKIATHLNIKKPKSISASSELYLQGSELLALRIKYLENTNNQILTDEKLLNLKAQKSLLEGSPHIDHLIQERERLASQTEVIKLYSLDFNSPETPTNPPKPLIIIAGIFLGCLIGIMIAIGKIIFRKPEETNVI